MIPDDIRKKIEEAANKVYHEKQPGWGHEGAEFSYSLAQKEIAELKRSILSGLKVEGEQKQEIERLKAQLKEIQNL